MNGPMSTLPGGWRPYALVADELTRNGDAAEIYDSNWRLRWVSPELRQVLREPTDDEIGIGRHVLELFGREPWRSRVSEESRRSALRRSLPYHLYGSDPEDLSDLGNLAEMIAETEARQPPDLWSVDLEFLEDELPPLAINCLTLKFSEGDFSGYIRIYSAGMRASLLTLVARGSVELFERMSRLVEPGRHPVAILFCDIEGSTELARRLPSAVYFELVAGLAKIVDDIVISHDGVVGKHAGDGASAYFLADDHGQASAATRAAIVSSWEIRSESDRLVEEIIAANDLECLEVEINVGLHWGSTVYMGQIISGGRLEVTALGDEVNECSRLEQAARGGKTLASKHFMERLDEEDANFLGIGIRSITYRQLDESADVSEKIHRDIGSIPTCYLPPRALDS